MFQAVADVGGGVLAKVADLAGQSLRLPKITAIEQRNRKDHPSERAVIRKPGFAGRRFRNSLQIRPYSEHYLEQIQGTQWHQQRPSICFSRAAARDSARQWSGRSS